MSLGIDPCPPLGGDQVGYYRKVLAALEAEVPAGVEKHGLRGPDPGFSEDQVNQPFRPAFRRLSHRTAPHQHCLCEAQGLDTATPRGNPKQSGQKISKRFAPTNAGTALQYVSEITTQST